MMNRKHIVNILLTAFIMHLFCACNMLKTVPPDDKLFTGSTVEIKDGKIFKDQKKELLSIARPKPNKSIFGIKYRLAIFNAIKEPAKPKGLWYKIKHKWGEAPVLLSQARPKATELRMNDYLFSIGYLRPEVKSEVIAKGRKASLNYNITHGTRYAVGKIVLPDDSSNISALIRKASKESLVKPGEFLSLNILKAERERIDAYLKQNGHYFFVPDFLIFRVDSLHEGLADVYIRLKPDIPDHAKEVWKIGNITVYGNYTLERDSVISKMKGERQKNFTLVDPRNSYRPSLYDRAIVLKEGRMYRRNPHSLTIERLMNLGTFRFVKLTFTPNADSAKPTLDTRIYITPSKKQSVRFELSGNSKSNNFVGSELAINYRNINLFKSAEILEARITGGFDTQVGGDQVSSNAYTLKGEVNLFIPKMLVPWKVPNGRNPYMARTVFTPAIEYVERPDLYTVRSLRFSAGYNWKKGKSQEHMFRLININSINPSNITPKFDSILQQDASLKAAFEKQLIIGSAYSYKFNNTYRGNRRLNFAFDGSISTSGNVVGLFINPTVDTVGSKKIFGTPISQYLRVQGDLRSYWRMSDKFILVNRIVAGAAVPYGNSNAVPYSEQFFIGGSSSLRAFRTRTLGPGSYHTEKSSLEANESGELKLELNAEMRMSVSKLIKLAAFVDAGNIWLRNDAIDKPGSGLDKGDLFGEMAVGSGLGLRFDATVLVIRFDVAFPLRKPWYPEGNRWVLKEIDIWNSSWRKDNLILNIGIGYPF